MKASLLATVLLLAGCTGAGLQSPNANWLAGAWLEMSGGAKHPLACESDMPIKYEAGGSYSLLDEVGTWRLDNNVLTEIATHATEAGDPAAVEIRRPYVSTIQRLGDDRFLKRLANGRLLEFRRCPEYR